MAAKYRLRDSDLDWVESSTETVILDDASEQYFATNRSGGLLWSALKEEQTADQLVAILVGEFGIPEQVANNDVESFLATLRQLDLLEVVE